jgi:nucleotide-binding universal stress UspA family protein
MAKGAAVETVICGVDASVGARAALRIAADLGEMFGFRVVAVHVVDRTAGDGEHGIGGAMLRARGRAERVLAQVLDDEELVGKVDWRAEVGDTAERLAAVADEERAALIVLGSRTPRVGAEHRSPLANEIAKMTAVPVAVPAEERIVTGGRKPERRDDDCSSSNGRLDAAAPREPREQAA